MRCSVRRVTILLEKVSTYTCERFREHNKDYQGNSDNSHMAKHVSLVHGSDDCMPVFDIRVVKFCKTAIERQVLEAVRIAYRASEPGVVIMNSKSEFNRCTLPRIVMFCGDKSNEVENNVPQNAESSEGGKVTTHKNKYGRYNSPFSLFLKYKLGRGEVYGGR